MAQFQAVVAGVSGHGAGLIALSATMLDLTCQEAEELAMRLAGAELGRNVTDGPEFIRSLREADQKVQSAALNAWAEANPDAALRALLTPAGLKLATAYGVIQRLAERDPDKALQWLQSTGGRAGMNNGWAAVSAACAAKDTALALSVVQSAPFAARSQGMDTIARTLAGKDPQAALAWRNELSPELRRLVSSQTIFEKWGETDPAAALAAWKANDPESIHNNYQLAATWARRDPAGALRWATENPAFDNAGYFVSLGIAWLGAEDPQRALAILGSVKNPDQGTGAFNGIASAWAAKDFPSALTWARTLTDGRGKNEAFAGLASAADQLPEAERRALAAEIGPHSASSFLLLWRMEPAEATPRFASLPPDQRLSAWQSMSSNLIRESPAEAAAFAALLPNEPASGSDSFSSGSTLSQAASMVATSWAQRDPVAAAAWVSSLPAGEAQTWAASNLVGSWSRHDLDGAVAWTQNLIPGPAKDKALQQLGATAASGGDPAAAMRWVASVENAQQREQAIRQRYAAWSASDPAAARSAVDALVVSTDEKQRILSGQVKGN